MLDDIETKHPMGYVDIFLFNYIEGVKLNYIFIYTSVGCSSAVCYYKLDSCMAIGMTVKLQISCSNRTKYCGNIMVMEMNIVVIMQGKVRVLMVIPWLRIADIPIPAYIIFIMYILFVSHVYFVPVTYSFFHVLL